MTEARTMAVFGGSFDPPHVAHQMVCLYVLETQPVDELVVVPCFRHPFDKELCAFEHRLEMSRRAMAALGRRVWVSDVEARLGGEASRTLLTLRELAREHPGVQLRLVIGSDILPEREKWWRWDDIEALAPPVVVSRAGHTDHDAGGGVALPPISSTEIRRRVGEGADISHLVPASVARYIEEQGLYR